MTEHSADSSPDSATKKTFPPEKSNSKTKADSTLPSPETGTLIICSLALLFANQNDTIVSCLSIITQNLYLINHRR